MQVGGLISKFTFSGIASEIPKVLLPGLVNKQAPFLLSSEVHNELSI